MDLGTVPPTVGDYYDLDYDLGYDFASFENYTGEHGGWPGGGNSTEVVYPGLSTWEYIR